MYKLEALGLSSDESTGLQTRLRELGVVVHVELDEVLIEWTDDKFTPIVLMMVRRYTTNWVLTDARDDAISVWVPPKHRSIHPYSFVLDNTRVTIKPYITA